eukprot:s1976_g5.t1
MSWFAIAGVQYSDMDVIMSEFGFLWMQEVAKTKLASGNRRGAAFPLRPGELTDLEQVFAKLALADLAVMPLVNMWAHKAWAYVAMCALNHLAGMGARLAPGPWSQPERKAAESVLAAVNRRSAAAEPHPTSEDVWQKDVGRRRMGYNGEEMAVCHELTWEQGLSEENQVLRGRVLPAWMNCVLRESQQLSKSWWHVYLDNYAGGERIEPGETALDAARCHDLAEEAWQAAGVVSSEKKRIRAAHRVTELGAEVDGETKTLGVSTAKLVKVIQDTLWMLSQKSSNRKHVQILAGRWIFILQFRRPAMSYLQKAWAFISGSCPLTPRLRSEVKGEFVALICISPLLHCFLGASVSDVVICTDASESGGSVELTRSLKPEGRDFLTASDEMERSRGNKTVPILVISLFNGIGGSFRCYDILGLEPCGRIAVELDAAANRTTQRRWPSVLVIRDVRSVNRETVRSWSTKFLRISEIHLWAGWPCVDLSAVKHNRQNLQGPQSSLFWEVPRIRDLLREEFGETVLIKHILENVASLQA